MRRRMLLWLIPGAVAFASLFVRLFVPLPERLGLAADYLGGVISVTSFLAVFLLSHKLMRFKHLAGEFLDLLNRAKGG